MNGLSQDMIARTAHVSKHSVQDVLEAAREQGISWEDVEGIPEEATYALLFPGRGRRRVGARQSNFHGLTGAARGRGHVRAERDMAELRVLLGSENERTLR